MEICFKIFFLTKYSFHLPETGNSTELNIFFFFFNWDSLHARLNSHDEAWSYKKRSTKRITDKENLFRKNLELKDVC